MELFAKASKNKIRFETSKGLLSTEELWDLGLHSLDKLAIGLNRQLKESATESFVVETPRADTILQMKFDVVLAVITSKKQDAQEAASRAETSERNELIRSIISDKKNEELKSKSLEELEALVSK